MSSGVKTLRGNITIWAVRPEAFTPDEWMQPLSAAKWATAKTAGLITHISKAVEDGHSINLTGSATDSSMSAWDIAEVESPLDFEYEVSFDIFRNKPGTIDSPDYDKALALFDGLDIEYFIVKRVDSEQGLDVVAGNILSAFGAKTDYGQDLGDDGSMQMYGCRFKPTGRLNTNFTVAA
jgi:hypothetical protein